jgi:hypothetical protein
MKVGFRGFYLFSNLRRPLTPVREIELVARWSPSHIELALIWFRCPADVTHGANAVKAHLSSPASASLDRGSENRPRRELRSFLVAEFVLRSHLDRPA